MQKYHICHVCGEKMYPIVEPHEYSFKCFVVTVPDVRVFQCDNCGEEILESEEAKRVEDIILAQINTKHK